MPLVTTLPKKGGSAKAYDIPESELAKYEAVEAKQTSYDEGKGRVGEGEEIAGGIEIDQADVQAYSNICICWIHIGHRWYYRYQYCWQSCP
jgi:hypothetical protein